MVFGFQKMNLETRLKRINEARTMGDGKGYYIEINKSGLIIEDLDEDLYGCGRAEFEAERERARKKKIERYISFYKEAIFTDPYDFKEMKRIVQKYLPMRFGKGMRQDLDGYEGFEIKDIFSDLIRYANKISERK